jgi:hypothetical protein
VKIASVALGAVVGVGIVLLSSGTVARRAAGRQVAARAGGVPVVVELFTSEGCSSCPPADALLAKLEAEQSVSGAEVIALEEHVDYWNGGGWFDPFSSDSATLRQREYAAVLGNENPYTPQMVVDGREQLVGSRAGRALSVIGQAASRKKAEVSIAPVGGGEKFRVSVGALDDLSSRDGGAAEIWMAVTETGLHSNVRAGENSGQDLHHAAVVRRLWKIGALKDGGGAGFTGEETVKVDRAWRRENLRVVVFVQEKKGKKILGAGSARLPA